MGRVPSSNFEEKIGASGQGSQNFCKLPDVSNCMSALGGQNQTNEGMKEAPCLEAARQCIHVHVDKHKIAEEHLKLHEEGGGSCNQTLNTTN